jgi:threonine/homoserine efflux transporter RhtA
VPPLAYYIVMVIDWAGTLVGLIAFIHAVMQRSDAFTAADRLTKPAWLGITGGATVAMGLFQFYGAGMIFWLAALVASLVYVVDVRPKLIEVQRGGSSW